MKHNYKLNFKNAFILIIFLITATGYSQGNILCTFLNAENTNDGTNDYYEVDILIQTNNGQADLKIGSGQIYFDYNTAAFGENVSTNGRIEVTFPNPDYIVGQFIDTANASLYTTVINDNITSRVSWVFYQVFSGNTIANNNVTAIPAKLIHLKLTYVDVNETPNVTFVENDDIVNSATDQFFTACGDSSGGTDPYAPADCGTVYGGTQFFNSVFNSANAIIETLAIPSLNVSTFSMHPNPIKTNDTNIHFNLPNGVDQLSVTLFDILGKVVQKYTNVPVQTGANSIDKPKVAQGLYLVKFSFNNGEQQITKRLIIE